MMDFQVPQRGCCLYQRCSTARAELTASLFRRDMRAQLAWLPCAENLTIAAHGPPVQAARVVVACERREHRQVNGNLPGGVRL